jgi:redox-sensitive bicupin YhaK (pirin superfamily)
VSIDIRRSASRFVTTEPGRTTRHSFSFGAHYDPANVGFGPLVCHNDDLVQPGAGYPDHPHRDTEIVTWVLTGALSHRDSDGRSGVVGPGTVQVMSAGSGIIHAETVEPGAGTTRFVQTWVRPDAPGGDPSYATADVAVGGLWQPVASGSRPDAATRIGARGATLWVASPPAGTTVVLPEGDHVHLFVATGEVELDGVRLGEADTARLTDHPAELVTASPAQLLAWALD